MRLHSRFECLFRTLPDGQRVYYRQGVHGPGLMLQGTEQEASLWHLLSKLDSIDLLNLLLSVGALFSPWADSIPFHLYLATFVVIAAAQIARLAFVNRRISRLLKDCPRVAERLSEHELNGCRRARASSGEFARSAIPLLMTLLLVVVVGLVALSQARHSVLSELVILAILLALGLRLFQMRRDWKLKGTVD